MLLSGGALDGRQSSCRVVRVIASRLLTLCRLLLASDFQTVHTHTSFVDRPLQAQLHTGERGETVSCVLEKEGFGWQIARWAGDHTVRDLWRETTPGSK